MKEQPKIRIECTNEKCGVGANVSFKQAKEYLNAHGNQGMLKVGDVIETNRCPKCFTASDTGNVQAFVKASA